MMSLYTGTPGSGKSFHMAHRIYNALRNHDVNIRCRTFENMSTLRFEEGGAFTQLFKKIYLNLDAAATRVDLALDDHSGLLAMDSMIDSAKKSAQLDSRIRSVEVVEKFQGKDARGRTLYIGHESSAFRLRIYDKAKQMYEPGDAEYSMPWIRVEIVMRGKNADGFVNAFFNTIDLGSLAAGILNDHIRFIERDDSNITRCSTAQWWLDFIETVESVKLFLPEPIKHSIDRSTDWLTYQCSPSMAMVYHSLGPTQFMKILQYGLDHLSPKHKSLMKDYEERKMSHKSSTWVLAAEA